MHTSLLALLLLSTTHTALASFDNSIFYFAGNNGNSSALRLCKGMPFECEPPRLCAMDSLTNKHYCCSVSGQDGVCWLAASQCEGGGDTVPSSSQIQCVRGTSKWCCLKDVEECSQRVDKINMCWSTQPDPVKLLDDAKLNQTYSSLTAANPSAASYVVSNWKDLTEATSSPTPSSPSSSTAPSTATGSSEAQPNGENHGLSGGAIGGIVSGVIIGLALIAVLSFLWWRRKSGRFGSSRGRISEIDGAERHHVDTKEYMYMKDGNPVSELAGNQEPVELGGK